MQSDEAPKRVRKGKATREKIIGIAEELIAAHGPDGFQLQNVTERLGITPPAIYNHFKDREDLVAQVAEKGGRALDERMRRRSGEDVLTSLRRNARDFVAFLVENPAHARIILWDMARQGTSGWTGLATSNIQIRDRMRAAFEAASATGEIQRVRVETYLQFIYIGTAAAVTWIDYQSEGAPDPAAPRNPSGKSSRATDATKSPVPLREFSAADVERLQDEVENLVNLLLSPVSPG